MKIKFNIEKKTISNTFYRKVVYTDRHIQVVFMCLIPGEFIHKEKHKGTQFFRVEQGKATAKVGERKYYLQDGDTLIVPPNTLHELHQTGNKPLKLYSIYSPPEHPRDRLDKRQPLDDD